MEFHQHTRSPKSPNYLSKMADEQHVEVVVSETERVEKPVRKLEKTVLDNFSNLVNPHEKVRVKSSINLLKHLVENQSAENENELKYALGRIIRGLGSPTVNARTGFYTALVALINIQDVTLEDIFEHLNKQLHKAGSNTKGENADVCVGQILTCGAIMRSNLWAKSSDDERTKILEMLLKSCKERTYLSLVAYMFITDMFEELNEKEFKKIFPLIKLEFSKPWPEQNIDTLYLLSCVQNKYPILVKSKLLRKTIGTEEIICLESLEELCSVLMTIPRMTALKHPIYEIISKQLAQSEHLSAFLGELDKNLERPNRNKQLIAIKIFSIILKNIKEMPVLPDLLTKNFVRQTLNYFKTFTGKEKDPEFQQSMHKFFETLLDAIKSEEVTSKTKIAVLKKLLFYPGTFIFEKVTRSKIIQQITSTLNKEGVTKLATVYKGVVKGTEKIDSENSLNENWLNNDRLYATHLLIKLLNHTAVKNENDWKVEQLGFLMNLGLLKPENGINIGCELAEDLQVILSQLVRQLDAKLTPDNLETILRNPIAKEDFETWQKTIAIIAKIDKKKKKGGLKSVFLTLFLHMGLQLFNDTKLASESLKELFICYERTKKSRKNSGNHDESEPNLNEENEVDPLWIEVVTDLFLNLLSHNYHLLRSLIKCVFPHLCQYMTATSVQQILSVLDPKNEDNPLSNHIEESSDDESVAEEESDLEEEEDASELEEIQDESVNDKLRMALHKVLGNNGYQTDEESVDLDQLSDTEGGKLDEALGEVFKQFRPNYGRRKKQSKDQETLTHFRIRVLDLIEIYLDADPSMILTLEIMLPLLQAVEFSIRDEHQKPLHDRLKSCLKKLSQLRKFSDTKGVNETVLSDLLKSLLEKGTKNSMIIQDMGIQIADCCIFIIRCSDLLISIESTPKKMRKQLKSSIAEIISCELQSYFHKRDCLTPYVLFKNTLQLSWDGVLSLVPLLQEYIFSEDIKPFKKSQALELLRLFYTNQRYLSTNPEKIKEMLSSIHLEFSSNVLTLFKNLCENPIQKNVREKFICNLFHLLTAVKCSRLNIDNISWSEIAESVRKYRSYVTFSKDAKTAFRKLCNQLGVSYIVKMKPRTTTLAADDTESGNSKVETKKEKQKRKTSNKETLKLKKEAKELRLRSLSEGFGKLDFASATDVSIKESEEEGDIAKGVGEIQRNKQSKKLTQVNGSIDKSKNGMKKRRKSEAAIDSEISESEGNSSNKLKRKMKGDGENNMNDKSKDNHISKKRLSDEDGTFKKTEEIIHQVIFCY
ncbi:hypothetical protein NQ314_015747 [Rhamnusium bicolor]|uniref:DNA polymerase V n=1 Tax=Rhamnusium bicolor TaxID=1586634 RepID=A0AAV8WY28_9CUCU|nr:hypothetical protein NQ314_015747 [Rhamnusium bicolor]